MPIQVSGVGRPSSLTFSIDGSSCTTDVGATTVGIDHTFIGELVGTLTAPNGQTATLFPFTGGPGNNLCRVVFDDAAAEPFFGLSPDQAPFTGTYRPDRPLSGLRGGNADGTWTFRVTDNGPTDLGSIHTVTLRVAGFLAD